MKQNKKSKTMKLAWEGMNDEQRQDWYVKNTKADIDSDNKREHTQEIDDVSEEMHKVKVSTPPTTIKLWLPGTWIWPSQRSNTNKSVL